MSNNCARCSSSIEDCNERRRRVGGKLGYCCPTCRTDPSAAHPATPASDLNWLIEKIEPTGLSNTDFDWLIEKTELALHLDAFVTTEKDRERLARIRELRDRRER